MNEEYLLSAYESFGGQEKLKVDFETWISKIKDNEDYKQGMFNNFGGQEKLKSSYDDWNGKVFGLKKKETTQLNSDNTNLDSSTGKESTSLVSEQGKKSPEFATDEQLKELQKSTGLSDEEFNQRRESVQNYSPKPLKKEEDFSKKEYTEAERSGFFDVNKETGDTEVLDINNKALKVDVKGFDNVKMQSITDKLKQSSILNNNIIRDIDIDIQRKRRADLTNGEKAKAFVKDKFTLIGEVFGFKNEQELKQVSSYERQDRINEAIKIQQAEFFKNLDTDESKVFNNYLNKRKEKISKQYKESEFINNHLSKNVYPKAISEYNGLNNKIKILYDKGQENLSEEEVNTYNQLSEELNKKGNEIKNYDEQYIANRKYMIDSTDDILKFSDELNLAKRDFSWWKNRPVSLVKNVQYMAENILSFSGNIIYESLLQKSNLFRQEGDNLFKEWSRNTSERKQEFEGSKNIRKQFTDINSVGDFGEYSADLVIDQLPNYALLWLTGGAGTALLGASSGGDRMGQLLLDKANGDNNYSYSDITKNAALYAMSEAVFEIATAKILGSYKGMMKNIKSSDISKRTFKQNFISGVNFMYNRALEGNQEGLSEVGTGVGQYLSDRLLGEDNGLNLTEEYFSGIMMSSTGIMIGVRNKIIGEASNKKSREKVRQNVKTIVRLEDFINSSKNKMTKESIDSYKSLINELNRENTVIINASAQNLKNIKPEQRQKIQFLNNKLKSLQVALMSEKAEKGKEILLNEINKISEEKDNIISLVQNGESTIEKRTNVFAQGLGDVNDLSEIGRDLAEVKIDGANVILTSDGDNIKIQSLSVLLKDRGNGFAKKALGKIIALADKRGVSVVLDVVPMDDTTNKEKLVKLYEGFGFKSDGKGGMSRLPGAESTTKNSIKSDFDNTLYDNKTGQLTELGQEIKTKIANGEDVTILTAREDTGENRQFIAEKLGISPDKVKLGLTPQGKADNVNTGDTFYDDNADNIKAVEEKGGSNVVDVKENEDLDFSGINEIISDVKEIENNQLFDKERELSYQTKSGEDKTFIAGEVTTKTQDGFGNTKATRFSISDKSGQELGHVNYNDNGDGVVQVETTALDNDLSDKSKGRGLGSLMYLNLIEQLAKKGKTLKSGSVKDGKLTDSALFMWNKLLQSGIASFDGEFYSTNLTKEKSDGLESKPNQEKEANTDKGLKVVEEKKEKTNQIKTDPNEAQAKGDTVTDENVQSGDNIDNNKGKDKDVQPTVESKTDTKSVKITTKGNEYTVVLKNGELEITPRLGNTVTDSQRKAVIKAYSEGMSFTDGRVANFQGMEDASLDEQTDRVIEDSENPAEIVEEVIKVKEKGLENKGNIVISKDQAIYEVLSNYALNDRAKKDITDLKPYYTNVGFRANKEKIGIDKAREKAESILGDNVSEADVLSFLERFENLRNYTESVGTSAKNQENDLKERFKQITGLNLTDALIEKIISNENNLGSQEDSSNIDFDNNSEEDIPFQTKSNVSRSIINQNLTNLVNRLNLTGLAKSVYIWGTNEINTFLESISNGKAKLQVTESGILKEESTNNLAVVHNLSIIKLLNIFKIGGISVPSLAIINTENPYTSFGEITLVADNSLIDPKKSRRNRVYGADVYSARYPSVTFDIAFKVFDKLAKRISNAFDFTLSGRPVDMDAIESNGRRDLEENKQLQLLFLKEKGLLKKVVMNKLDSPIGKRQLNAFNKISKRKNNDYINTNDYISPQGKYYNEFNEFIKNILEKEVNETEDADLKKTLKNRWINKDGSVNEYILRDRFFKINSSIKHINNPEINVVETLNKNKFKASSQEYMDFVDEIYKGLNVKEKIFTGYNERTGAPKYIPHSLENVVRLMRNKDRAGEGFFYGLGTLRAKVTPRFKSIRDVKKNKKRIVSKSDFEKIKKEIDKEYMAITESMRTSIKQYTHSTELASEAMYEVVTRGYSQDYDLSESKIEDIVEFMTKLKNLPTEYFEVKINRAVGLSEFKTAIVPDDTPKFVIKKLKEAGLKVKIYKSKDEFTGKRMSNIQEDLRFQKELQKNNIQLLKKPLFQKDGKQKENIYGFVYEGEVYINRDIAKLDTPIHEFGHLWVDFVKGKNKDVYQKGLDLIKGSEYHTDVKNNPSYAHLGPKAILEEALAQAIGEKGVKILDESRLTRFKSWFKKLFNEVARGFNLRTMSSEQLANVTLGRFTDLASAELLSGKEVRPINYKVPKPGKYRDITNIELVMESAKERIEALDKLKAKVKAKEELVKDVKKEIQDYVLNAIDSGLNGFAKASERSRLMSLIRLGTTFNNLNKAIEYIDDLLPKLEERQVKYNNKISSDKESLRERARSKKNMSEEVRKEIVKFMYAQLNKINMSEINKANIGSLLNIAKNVRSAKGLLSAFEKADALFLKIDSKVILNDIYKILAKNFSKKVYGRAKANLVTEEAETILNVVKEVKEQIKVNRAKNFILLNTYIDKQSELNEKLNKTEKDYLVLEGLDIAIKLIQSYTTTNMDSQNEMRYEVFNQILDIYEEGKSDLKFLRDQQKEYLEGKIKEFNKDARSDKSNLNLKTTQDLDKEAKKTINRFQRAVFSVVSGYMTGSLDSIMTIISKRKFRDRDDSPLVDLVNRFKRKEREKKKRIRVYSEVLISKQKTLFGSQRKAEIAFKSIQKVKSRRRFDESDPNSPIGELEITHSNAELLNLWMNYRNPDLRPALELNGYDDQFFNEIDLSDEMKLYGEFLYKFYESIHKESDDVYKKMYFHSMGKVDFYAGKISRRRDGSSQRDLSPEGASFSAHTTGFGSQKERTSNSPIIAADANQLAMRAIAESSHFIAYAEIHKEFSKLTKNEEFNKAVRFNNPKYGDKIMGVLNFFIANDLERGGVEKIYWLLDYLGRNLIVSTLSGKIKVGVTQIISFFNGASDLPPKMEKYFYKYYNPKAIRDGFKEIKLISDFLNLRYDLDGVENAISGLSDSTESNTLFTENATIEANRKAVARFMNRSIRKAMTNVKVGDKIGVMGAVPVFLAWRDVYIADGLSHSEATAKALFKFESSADRTQQTNSTAGKSEFQKHPIFRYFAMYATSPIQNMQNANYHWRELSRNLSKDKNGKGSNRNHIIGILNYQFAQPMLYTYLSQLLAGSLLSVFGFGGDEPDDADKTLLNSIILSNYGSIPFFGGMITYVIDTISGKEFSYGGLLSSPLLSVITKLESDFKTLERTNNPNTAAKYKKRIVKTLIGITIGAPEILIGMFLEWDEIYWNDEVDNIVKAQKLLGYSNYAIEQSRSKRISRIQGRKNRLIEEKKYKKKYNKLKDKETKVKEVFLKGNNKR